jgi:hypothetical protein
VVAVVTIWPSNEYDFCAKKAYVKRLQVCPKKCKSGKESQIKDVKIGTPLYE